MPVTMVAGAYRRAGWRAALRDRGVTIWRCQCDRPHASKSAADGCGLAALRAHLGRRGMRVWSATYRPKPQHQLTPEEIARMEEARELVMLETQIALPSWERADSLPEATEEAIASLARLEDAALSAAKLEEIRHYKRTMELIQVLHKESDEVRKRAQYAIMCCDWRTGVELHAWAARRGFATGTRGQLVGPGVIGGANQSQPIDEAPTLKELVGDRKFAWRAMELGELSLAEGRAICATLHLAKKEAVLSNIVDIKRGRETKDRREASLNADPIPDGMDYRIGDCRGAVMDDIADETVAALITDPPYGRDALPLVEFAAEFASRKLVEGGSAIFYVGTGLLPDYHAILSKYLTYWWEPVLLNDSAQKLLGAGVRASHKKILWYVKGRRRRAVHGERITIVPDVLNDYRPEEMQRDVELEERVRAMSSRDKSDHQWAQGDAGVRVWIHHLTRQGLIDPETGEILEEPELIVDLFAGTGTWGRIAADMGRRWIGCDIEAGGTEDIVADELSEVAE